MEKQNDRTANAVSRGGIDQLNKGVDTANEEKADVTIRGGIDQLNKGIISTPSEDLKP